MLKTLFDAHPNVKIPPELPVFLPIYQKFKNTREWNEGEILSFVDHVFADNTFNLRKIDNYHIDRELFTARLLSLQGKLTIQDLLFKLNEYSFSIFKKSDIYLVGDKNPVYSIFTRQLAKIFPEAKFICIVRDFRDNYISLKNLKNVAMEAPVLPLQVVRWKAISRTFLSCRQQFPDRFYIIRYEDLVTHPENEFSKICEFLELPYVESVFQFYEKKDEFVSMVKDPRILEIHRSLLYPVNTTRIGLWKGELSPAEKMLAAGIAGETAKKLGYISIDQKPGWSNRMKTVPWYIYNFLLFRFMIMGSKTPYAINRFLLVNVLRLARVYKKIAG